MEIKIKIEGLREIQRAMRDLPQRVERRLLEKSLIAGAVLVRDEARRLAPILQIPDPRRRAGTLRRAIRVGRVRPEQYTATVWVRMRALTRRQVTKFKKTRRGAAGAENPNDPFYWRFVEFGTSKMTARPFLRPAFEARKFAAVKRAIEDARNRVQTEIAKLGRSAGTLGRLRRAL